jgi:cation transport ATPase
LDNNILTKYYKKFILSAVLSLPIMMTMFLDIKKIFVNNIFWVDLILLLFGFVVVFVVGWNFHV